MLKLDPNHIALAIMDDGIYIVDPEGKVLQHHVTSAFMNIEDLASNEPGLLWISSSSGISKMLYDYPVTAVDHQSGLKLFWPSVIQHQDQTIILSSGQLYRPIENNDPYQPTQFQPWDLSVPGGVWQSDLLNKVCFWEIHLGCIF